MVSGTVVGVLFLLVFFRCLGRRGGRVGGATAGCEGWLHRALTVPSLLGGAPRSRAIVNGTLAAASGIGLQQWFPGLLLWIAGHALAMWGARLDAQFVEVFARHVKHRPFLDVAA